MDISQEVATALEIHLTQVIRETLQREGSSLRTVYDNIDLVCDGLVNSIRACQAAAFRNLVRTLAEQDAA